MSIACQGCFLRQGQRLVAEGVAPWVRRVDLACFDIRKKGFSKTRRHTNPTNCRLYSSVSSSKVQSLCVARFCATFLFTRKPG
jgi:hypothetical protein